VRRVLVTGSRDLDQKGIVYEALWHQARVAGGLNNLTVIHGAANGADSIASEWCKDWPEVTEEKVPADWTRDCGQGCFHKPRYRNGQRYCPVAGNLRNQEMVDRGADVCLAFPRGEARGTNDCIRRAKKAGIPVILG
jgi:hypothetical protein